MLNLWGFSYNLYVIFSTLAFLIIAYFLVPNNVSEKRQTVTLLSLGAVITAIGTTISYCLTGEYFDALISLMMPLVVSVMIINIINSLIFRRDKRFNTRDFIKTASLLLVLVTLILRMILLPLLFGFIGTYILRI